MLTVFMERYAMPVGRILLAALFLYAAYGKITDFSNTLSYLQGAVMWPTLVLIVAILLEVGGGLSLLFGFKTRWGAWALIVFVAAASLVFHNFLKDASQIIMFLKNFAIIGGLLYVAAHGPGIWSMDSRRHITPVM